jgi:hypothetical protein
VDYDYHHCEVQSGVEFMAQYREDEILYHTLFSDPPTCGGTVVEIGGFTGKRYSNSWFFQYALGWRALLVEALPSNFEQMVLNRPGAIHVSGLFVLEHLLDFKRERIELLGALHKT